MPNGVASRNTPVGGCGSGGTGETPSHHRATSGKTRLIRERRSGCPLAGVTRMYLRWGVAGGILGATEHRGCQPGQEHLGGPTRPMGERSDLNPWCYLAARWILVCLHLRRYKWASSPNRCVQLLAQKSTPQPQTQGECSMKEEEKASHCRYIALDINRVGLRQVLFGGGGGESRGERDTASILN